MVPGLPVHVIHRGNNREACFFKDQDRAFYLFHLGRLLPRTDCRLHAYCLMSNHVHLLLTGQKASACGLLMKGIAQLHAQYINKTYGRSGYVWESRYKSCLVQSEEYLLTCYRYVELNPVRAGLVHRPGDYSWSSYAGNALGEACPLITPHDEYRALGRDEPERQAVYRDLFGSPMRDDQLQQIRTATNGGFVLGSTSFKRALSRALGRRVEKGLPGRPLREATRKDEQLDLL